MVPSPNQSSGNMRVQFIKRASKSAETSGEATRAAVPICAPYTDGQDLLRVYTADRPAYGMHRRPPPVFSVVLSLAGDVADHAVFTIPAAQAGAIQ